MRVDVEMFVAFKSTAEYSRLFAYNFVLKLLFESTLSTFKYM